MANIAKKAPQDMGRVSEVNTAETVEETTAEIPAEETVESVFLADDRVAKLEAQIELLTQMLMSQKAAAAVAPAKSKLDDEVTVVHTFQCAPGLRTHIVLSNMTIDFRDFGEERTLPRMVFEELIGKYRHWFEQGILAPGPEAGDVAKLYNLKVSTQLGFSKDTLKKIPKMSVYELEDLFTKLGETHRGVILEMFRRGCLEKNPDYKDIHKIEMLNRVSKGALDSVLGDIKYEQYLAKKQK